MNRIHIIGGGLAGSEAAWRVAGSGVLAGGALAVDRVGFSKAVEAALAAEKRSRSSEGLKRTAQQDGSLRALERIRATSDQLESLPLSSTWIPGTSPGMTIEGLIGPARIPL